MPDPELTARLQEAREKANQAASNRARAEAQVEQFAGTVRQLGDEIRSHGIDPKQLDAEIARLEAELVEKTTELESVLDGN